MQLVVHSLIFKMMKDFEHVMQDLPIFLREAVDYCSENQHPLDGSE